jgi:hypothetical protein
MGLTPELELASQFSTTNLASTYPVTMSHICALEYRVLLGKLFFGVEQQLKAESTDFRAIRLHCLLEGSLMLLQRKKTSTLC